MIGKINSIQTLGTVDGPGIRFVVFLQGCHLRCCYCHNPETWDSASGKDISAIEVFHKLQRYKSYFKNKGGLTISGGEPLLQGEFVVELLTLCKDDGILTAIDTSGAVISKYNEAIIKLTDLIILDIKMENNEMYKKYIGCDMNIVIRFLNMANEANTDIWIRQVIVPDINDNVDGIISLCKLANSYSCVKKIQLLPFRKLCVEKYSQLGIDFSLLNTPETTNETIIELENVVSTYFIK